MAIRNKAALNVPVYTFLYVFGGRRHSFLSAVYPGVELPGVFSISRNCQTRFQDVDQFTAPAAMQKSMLSPDIWWCQTFLFQPFWWKEIVFHCCLILVSLITKDVEHL